MMLMTGFLVIGNEKSSVLFQLFNKLNNFKHFSVAFSLVSKELLVSLEI